MLLNREHYANHIMEKTLQYPGLPYVGPVRISKIVSSDIIK